MLREVELPGLNDKVKHDLQLLAMDGHPNEICGVLHPHHIIHQYPNVFCADHRLGFDMDVELRNHEIVAIWHSHPGGLTTPSRDDLKAMQQLCLQGYSYPWIIVTNKSVTAWELE